MIKNYSLLSDNAICTKDLDAKKEILHREGDLTISEDGVQPSPVPANEI